MSQSYSLRSSLDQSRNICHNKTCAITQIYHTQMWI